MKQIPKLNTKLVIIPHDGGTNPRNPYDHLTPGERQKKIVQLCARIYLRIRSKRAGDSTTLVSDPTSSETPAPVASGLQSEPEAVDGVR